MSPAIIDAITHAVAATRRRAEGLPEVAKMHSRATRRCLAEVPPRTPPEREL